MDVKQWKIDPFFPPPCAVSLAHFYSVWLGGPLVNLSLLSVTVLSFDWGHDRGGSPRGKVKEQQQAKKKQHSKKQKDQTGFKTKTRTRIALISTTFDWISGSIRIAQKDGIVCRRREGGGQSHHQVFVHQRALAAGAVRCDHLHRAAAEVHRGRWVFN